jgi:hypothetical protein
MSNALPLYNPGEPALCLATKKPTSIWQAINNIPKTVRIRMAVELWDIPEDEGHLLMAEGILLRIIETMRHDGDEVYIDPEGKYRIKIYPGPALTTGRPVRGGPPTFRGLTNTHKTLTAGA